MPHASYHRLVVARELLKERYAGPLSLRELSAAAGLSEFHLLRAYRTAFGETPHQHITRLRLERAKHLLARGAAVTDVCFDVGYSSLGSFSSLFARSPTASRPSCATTRATRSAWCSHGNSAAVRDVGPHSFLDVYGDRERPRKSRLAQA